MTADPGVRSATAELVDTVLSLMPDPAVVVDATGVVTHANAAVSTLFGYGDGELVGRRIEVLVPERLRSVHRDHRAGYADAPRARAMGAGLGLFGRRRDGSEIAVDISLAPLALDGETSTVAAIRDVSERREAEATRAQLAAIVEASTDAILAVSLDGVIESWNPGAARTLGFDAGTMIGAHVSVVVPEHSSEAFEDQLGAALAGEVRGSTDLELRTHDGGLLPAAVLIAPLRSGGDAVTGFSVVARDITERTRAEAELRRLLAEQTALVDELDRANAERERLLIGDERGRIARDLHDLVIQRLFASGLSLQSLLPMLGDDPAAQRVSEVVDELDATIREIRTTIFGLAPPPNTSSGLRADVLALVDEYRRPLGFDPATDFAGPVDSVVTDEQVPHILAVVREALANVARHAAAASVRVSVAAAPERIEVVITDDGTGIVGDGERGNGLRNLRARAEALGGSLAVEQPDAGGTTLRWVVPVG